MLLTKVDVSEHMSVNLAQYVARVLHEKGLSGYDIERISHREITQSYVNRIKNGEIKNPSPEKLKALAKGLGVSEDELFGVVRGVSSEPSSFDEALHVAFHDADDWSEDERQEALDFIKNYAEVVRARRARNL